MSGGVAYVLDPEHNLYQRVNKELVSIERITLKQDAATLKAILAEHVRETGSRKARKILSDFDAQLADFKKIVPRDYSHMLGLIAKFEASGMSRADAELEAFLKRGE